MARQSTANRRVGPRAVGKAIPRIAPALGPRFASAQVRDYCEATDHAEFCPVCKHWVSHNLTDAARSSGVRPDVLRSMFLSDDVSQRAAAYEVVASYHGWENFDAYPLTLSEEELDLRWAKVPG